MLALKYQVQVAYIQNVWPFNGLSGWHASKIHTRYDSDM